MWFWCGDSDIKRTSIQVRDAVRLDNSNKREALGRGPLSVASPSR
jgi:hypothetical protein